MADFNAPQSSPFEVQLARPRRRIPLASMVSANPDQAAGSLSMLPVERKVVIGEGLDKLLDHVDRVFGSQVDAHTPGVVNFEDTFQVPDSKLGVALAAASMLPAGKIAKGVVKAGVRAAEGAAPEIQVALSDLVNDGKWEALAKEWSVPKAWAKDENYRGLRQYIADKYGSYAPDLAEREQAAADAWLREIHGRPAGSSALKPNNKTFLSLDPTGKCPLDEAGMPCPQCYVAQPRAQNKIFMERGDANGVKMEPGENWAKAPKEYGTALYHDDIRSMPSSIIGYLNDQMGGLRVFSSGDYRPLDALTLDRAFDQAERQGLWMKSITKQPEFVERYGQRPNFRTNLSVDYLPENADVIGKGSPALTNLLADESANTQISRGWRMADALALKEANPDKVKIRHVAINPEDAIKAIADPRIDVETLFHGLSGTTKGKPDPEKVDKIIDVWREMMPDQFRGAKSGGSGVGEPTLRDLAGSFTAMDARKWADKVTQKQIDAVLGPGVMTKDEFVTLAKKKICCQTGRCGTSGAQCGFKNAGGQ